MSITVIFMVLTGIAWFLFDVYIIAKRGKHQSISAYIIRGSYKYPLLVLIFGMIIGHLFFSMKTEDIYKNIDCIPKEDTNVK